MRKICLWVALLTVLSGQAFASSVFMIDPAPAWGTATPTLAPTVDVNATATATFSATPTPVATVRARKSKAVIGTATPSATETPTPTLAPTLAPFVFLAPLRDSRGVKVLVRGANGWDDADVAAVGLTLQAKTWQLFGYKDISFLVHRELGRALGVQGVALIQATEPYPGDMSIIAAKQVGARYLLRGEIKRFNVRKKGADAIFGTSFTGNNYYFNSRVKLELRDLQTDKVVYKQDIEFQRQYYNPKSMSAPDTETYPHYFLRALPEACDRIAAESKLREALGLPRLTPTPTATVTLETTPPADGITPTPVLTPTPDNQPHWICPKDDREMLPEWDFCPWDKTKRADFILKKAKKK